MVLGRDAIHSRLVAGDVFRWNTWKCECLKEASYALRLADDELLLDGKFYDRGNHFKDGYIVIDPGKIAMLSTKEELVMPADLVGKIGIRLEFALLGLIGLMGIQVDPYYGQGKDHERLYIRVANFGNDPIRLSPGDEVFTFELHEVVGTGTVPKEPKKPSWPRIKKAIRNLSNASWTYVTRVEQDFTAQTENMREYLQPLVLFGVFLVAITILGVSITIILTLREVSPGQVPLWIKSWGWILLLTTLSLATLATACVGFASAFRLLRPYRFTKYPQQSLSLWSRCWQFLSNPFQRRP